MNAKEPRKPAKKLRILVIGAHPDDCEIKAGGVAALWSAKGHTVQLVSATNGATGHHAIGGVELVRRRTAEARAAARVLGCKSLILDLPNGEMEPSIAMRRVFLKLIREFQPDLILTHRPNDYHPDHRYTSQLVQDASYLLTVPNVCATTPHLPQMPVIMYCEDGFRKPLPFAPDVVVDIDPVIELKGDMLYEHESQVFEWLARGQEVPATAEARRSWIRARVKNRSHQTAERFRAQLCEAYGQERGSRVETAEAFEVCEYGAALTPERRARLFPCQTVPR
ncbi:MAG: PIG-L family deacetylase [Armatimonadetes bacterium]|nr:PIG-L family deacetylase [Armatimonadota bacterium]